MSSLTAQKLAAALKDNKSYKSAQSFLEEISNGNQQIIQVINTVFVDILNSDKIQLMSKLLVLRMFKDIFLLGNMELFDKLDPQIQQVIISAAAYNPNFKPKGKNDKQTRGGMYFVDTEKRQKNTQTIQLSNSFVLLATQVVKYFALWLPENPDKSSTRFLQAYQELQNLGVPFNTSIYFQPHQQQTFRKNYQAWLKKSQDEGGKQQIQRKPVKKDQISQQPKEISTKVQHKQQKKNRISQTKSSPSKQLQQEKQSINQKKVKVSQQNNLILQQQKNKKLEHQLECANNLKQKLKVKENQNKQLQEQILRRCKQNQQLNKKIFQMKQKQDKLIQKANDQQIKNNELQNNYRSLQNQIKRITVIKNDAMQKIDNLQKLIQQIKFQKSQIMKQLQLSKQKIENKNDQTQQNQNIKKLKMQFQKQKKKNINMEKTIEQLKLNQQQNVKKMNQYIVDMEILNNQKQLLIQELKMLKIKNQQNQQKDQKDLVLNQNRKQNQESKAKIILQQRVINQNPNLMQHETNFILQQKNQKEKEQKMYGTNQVIHNSEKLVSEKIFKNKQNSMSLSKFLGLRPHQDTQAFNLKSTLNTNKFHNTSNNFQNKKSKSSLHKTETPKFRYDLQEKERIQFQQKVNTFQGNNQQYSSFKKSNLKKNKNMITSIFPFIEEYFAPIKLKGSQQFRLCCLMQQARRYAFFSDQILQLRFIKPKNTNNAQISIKNKLSSPIDVNLQSQTNQISVIQLNYYHKIHPFNQIRLDVECRVTDLNFRVPVFNLNTLIDKKQYKYQIPIPTTLWSFVQLSQSPKQFERFQKYHQNNYKKHRSQKFIINKSIKSLPLIFPQLHFETNQSGQLQATTILTYPLIPQINLKLSLVQSKQFCEFQTQFIAQSKLSEGFSKVLLQVLMFMMI